MGQMEEGEPPAAGCCAPPSSVDACALLTRDWWLSCMKGTHRFPAPTGTMTEIIYQNSTFHASRCRELELKIGIGLDLIKCGRFVIPSGSSQSLSEVLHSLFLYTKF
jgi:hypothetical protein